MARPVKNIAVPRRGDVYLVRLDPTIGAEIKKTRPAVVIQNDIANRASPITIVAAITSQVDEELYPTDVLIRRGEAGLRSTSVVLLNQLRSVDRRRLLRRLGSLDSRTMARLNQALAISVGLVEL